MLLVRCFVLMGLALRRIGVWMLGRLGWIFMRFLGIRYSSSLALIPVFHHNSTQVYGPHIAVLYARQSAQQHVQCLGHYFNPTKSLENKLGLAASNFELTASLPHVVSYLTSDPTTFDKIAAHEAKLSKIVLDYLTSEPKITVHGLKTWDPKIRVPTISFTVEGVGSRKFVERVDEVSNVGIRWGHFYSKRLCEEVLGLGEECVVRISCVHYNTEDEMRGVVEVLKKVLAELA